MEPQKSTHQLFGFVLPSCNRSYYSFYTCFWMGLFSVISLASFSVETKNYTAPFSLNIHHSSALRNTYSPLTSESIRTNLYLLNADNTTRLADGVLTEYNNLFHDIVTLEDAYKFTNPNENLGLSRYGTILAIERRPLIYISDTLYFKLWKTTRRAYQLEFITISLNHPGMQAALEDAYLGTSTLLTLSGNTKINFSVNTDAASADVNRFRIIFRANLVPTTLPVTFTSLEGFQQNNKISIGWKAENEINVLKYEVEHSTTGIDFTKVNSIDVSKTNNAYNSYSWVDDKPAGGNNFYRIKSVDRDGSQKFSIIIKVASAKSDGSITIYPNPIRGNTINLQFTNQPTGVYQVRLMNNNGQVVYTGKFAVNVSNVSQTLFTNRLSGGIYQLEIKAPDNTTRVQKAVVQQ
ncbi:MAG: type sorting protein [Ferruginibacter sp.]|nr:type sorting protein [Ferruginibacter sp.]